LAFFNGLGILIHSTYINTQGKLMRLKCIACEALARPVYLSAAHSPHIVDVTLLKIGLHNQPGDLQQRLQEEINTANADGYDAIALAYALCGKATHGLTAGSVPVIIPKAHDCITLFLGSRDKYNQQQLDCPGTFWYEQDYIERGAFSPTPFALGSPTGTEQDIREVYEEYVEKYGKDNADYLMEVMGAWQSHYSRAVFIDIALGSSAPVEDRARSQAERRGWQYERIPGDLILIRRLLAGDWQDDFLVLERGQKVRMTYDEDVIGFE
jgi:hypothetical protein